jgi:hypothetical protein
VAVRNEFHVSACELSDGQSGTEATFLRVFQLLLPNLIQSHVPFLSTLIRDSLMGHLRRKYQGLSPFYE